MRHVRRFFDILLIVLLICLFVVPVAAAQDGVTDLAAPFTPIAAAALAVERLLQLIRNMISPDPEQGLLRRDGKALRYYTTLGGTALGLGMSFLGNMRLLAATDITINSTVDTVLTGIVIGMGTEIVHELIKVIAEGKTALRAAGEPKG